MNTASPAGKAACFLDRAVGALRKSRTNLCHRGVCAIASPCITLLLMFLVLDGEDIVKQHCVVEYVKGRVTLEECALSQAHA